MIKADEKTAGITVVTAVLNRAGALRETIQSVADQGYPRLDHIIIDGASSDGTLEVIKQSDEQIAAWTSERDNGVYEAMNKGWAMADPDHYVLFLGAGDRLLSLPKLLPPIGDSPPVYYGRVKLGKGTEFISHANWRLRLYNALHHQGLLVPKKLHPEPPFDTRFRLYADFDFNQRLSKIGVIFEPTDELVTFSATDGLTALTDVREMTCVVRKNYGRSWELLSRFCFFLAKTFPAVKQLKPIRNSSP